VEANESARTKCGDGDGAHVDALGDQGSHISAFRRQAPMSSRSASPAERLPRDEYAGYWRSIKIGADQRERLLAHALVGLNLRRTLPFEQAPVHGLLVLTGPPGTGKTTLALGLADQVARMLPKDTVQLLQVDPHALASAALGKSQQQTTQLFAQTIVEAALVGPLVVLLDEVETLAADRRRLSLEANPIDVHRTTDAVLAGMDMIARRHRSVIFLATTNFSEAVDSALLSRADLIENIGLPGYDARLEIIKDVLAALQTGWPHLKKLEDELPAYCRASEGLDGRRLRKAVLGAMAQSIAVAKDPTLLTSQDVIQSIRSSAAATTEVTHEAA